jgi:hypothetical protein
MKATFPMQDIRSWPRNAFENGQAEGFAWNIDAITHRVGSKKA